MVKVIEKKCPQDHACPLVKMCPVGAISQTGHKAPKVDGKKCISCMLCVSECPHQAFVEE